MLVNNVTARFNAITRQMTEMSQGTKTDPEERKISNKQS